MDAIYIKQDPLQAGDTWTWDEAPPDDYPNTTHTVKYEFQGPEKFTLTGTKPDADTNRFLLTAADSATKHPGIYRWIRYATLASDGSTRFTLNRGLIEILPNLATAAGGFDARSHNQRMVDLLTTAIEDLATKGVVELSVGGRSYRKEDLRTLHGMLNTYERRVASELGTKSKKTLYQFTPTT